MTQTGTQRAIVASFATGREQSFGGQNGVTGRVVSQPRKTWRTPWSVAGCNTPARSGRSKPSRWCKTTWAEHGYILAGCTPKVAATRLGVDSSNEHGGGAIFGQPEERQSSATRKDAVVSRQRELPRPSRMRFGRKIGTRATPDRPASAPVSNDDHRSRFERKALGKTTRRSRGCSASRHSFMTRDRAEGPRSPRGRHT